MKDSEEMDYDCHKYGKCEISTLEMYNIKYKKETNLNKHIISEHDFKHPDDLKEHEDITKKNLFSNSQIKTLKKHIKHEPPDDLSNLEYDEKVKLMKDSEMVWRAQSLDNFLSPNL